MSDVAFSREVHEEFAQRMETEINNIREDNKQLRASVAALTDMNVTVRELAVTMRNMSEEQRETREDVREIRTRVLNINLEPMKSELEAHTQKLGDIDGRLRALESAAAQTDDHEDRIKALESKPAKRWEAIVAAVIGAAVSFAMAMLTRGA